MIVFGHSKLEAEDPGEVAFGECHQALPPLLGPFLSLWSWDVSPLLPEPRVY